MTFQRTAATATQWAVAAVVTTVLALQLVVTVQKLYTICNGPPGRRTLESTTAVVQPPRGVVP